MSDIDHEPRRSIVPRRPGVWLLAAIVIFGVGHWSFSKFAPQPEATRVDVPLGRTATPQERAPATPEQSPQRGSTNEVVPDTICRVPGLSEGVPQKDIVLSPEIEREAIGGVVEKGRYRLRGAFSVNEGFRLGRWSMAFDLWENGQGAFYRRLNSKHQSSRIRWAVKNEMFEYETICPDPGERGSFAYSVRDGKLWLEAPDEIYLVLEPYAGSQLRDLPPL